MAGNRVPEKRRRLHRRLRKGPRATSMSGSPDSTDHYNFMTFLWDLIGRTPPGMDLNCIVDDPPPTRPLTPTCCWPPTRGCTQLRQTLMIA